MPRFICHSCAGCRNFSICDRRTSACNERLDIMHTQIQLFIREAAATECTHQRNKACLPDRLPKYC